MFHGIYNYWSGKLAGKLIFIEWEINKATIPDESLETLFFIFEKKIPYVLSVSIILLA